MSSVKSWLPSTSAWTVRLSGPTPEVWMVTSSVDSVTWSAFVLPSVMAPADSNVSPSSVTLDCRLVGTVPPVMVTSSRKVSSPTPSAWVIPSWASTVLAKVTAPAVAPIWIAAAVPSPIASVSPTAPLKSAPPAVLRIRFSFPSTRPLTVRAPVVVRVTALLESVSWSASIGGTRSLPNVTAPAESSVIPSRVTSACRFVAVPAPAMVTFSSKVSSPAPSAWVMPVTVSSVPSKTVAPAVPPICRDAPVPSPMGVPLPTSAWKVAPPAVLSTRSCPPSTSALATRAPVMVRITSVSVAVVSDSVTWSAALLPKVTAPPESRVMPSRTRLALKVLAVSPAATVTSSRKVTVPAAPAWKMPEAVPSVSSKAVVPSELIVRAAPVPEPIGAPEPTAALKTVVAPAFCTSRVRFCPPSTSALKVRLSPAPSVRRITAPSESVTWSASSLPKVTAPPEARVSPSNVTSALKMLPVSPSAMVTFCSKVTSPAPPACVMPEAVRSVLPNVVAPVELMVRAVPVPVPIGFTLPTAALKLAAPTVFKVRFCAPSSLALTVRMSPASIVAMLTGPPVSVT